jgi:nitrile hydratase accessory protein
VTSIDVLGEGGTTALPRSNGELVFNAPWESRAFGMAAALAEEQVFAWPDFQAGLIAAIAEWEATSDEPYDYYERWLTTLERLVASRDLVSVTDLDERMAVYQHRPAGHDHDADHDHDHADDHLHR